MLFLSIPGGGVGDGSGERRFHRLLLEDDGRYDPTSKQYYLKDGSLNSLVVTTGYGRARMIGKLQSMSFFFELQNLNYNLTPTIFNHLSNHSTIKFSLDRKLYVQHNFKLRL